mgnify:CR=1 FL=1|jgi:hypothetical protein
MEYKVEVPAYIIYKVEADSEEEAINVVQESVPSDLKEEIFIGEDGYNHMEAHLITS